MRKAILLLCMILMISCSNDDDKQTPIRVADEIKLEVTENNVTQFWTLKYEYTNGRISKVKYSLFGNPDVKTLSISYENDRPKSAVEINGDDVINYEFTYQGNILKEYINHTNNETIVFNYDENDRTYHAPQIALRFSLFSTNDLSGRTFFSTYLNYSYDDANQKGPFYNVLSKEYMPTILSAIQFTNREYFFQSIFPVDGFTDASDNLTVFTNQYDDDGFIIRSDFTDSVSGLDHRITYTYKML